MVRNWCKRLVLSNEMSKINHNTKVFFSQHACCLLLLNLWVNFSSVTNTDNFIRLLYAGCCCSSGYLESKKKGIYRHNSEKQEQMMKWLQAVLWVLLGIYLIVI